MSGEVKDTPLILDAKKDLAKADPFIDKLAKNKKLQKEFFENPAKVMIDLGMHVKTTDKVIEMTNRIFYATLSNKELMEFVKNNIPSYKISPKYKEYFVSSLLRGKVENDINADIIALNAYLQNTELLRKIFQLSLHDLNKKGLLGVIFTEQKINQYIETVLKHIKSNDSFSEIPSLVRFAPNYGVGSKITDETVTLPGGDNQGSSPIILAVAAPIAAIPVEVLAVITAEAAIPATALGLNGQINPGINTREELEKAKESEEGAKLLAALISFSNDLTQFIQDLPNRDYVGKQ